MSELKKMEKVQGNSQVVGSFIEEFLESKGIILATYHKHTKKLCEKDEYGWNCGWTTNQPIPLRYNIEELLAEYFNINLNKAEEEKQKILLTLRENK